ncbi:OPT family oligopeptide transporter [Nonomuraea sp. NPDC050783]|uniref:OPT family oligopeptide transporter n=1 Tax=Nonomuraea sp. NPDC050783 TaxID=3154634 RepID=UPI003466F718
MERELTVRAVVTGLAIGLVMTAAITYLALYSGLAVSAAVPAALVCTGIARGTARRAALRMGVLENNIAQTIASSGEALAVGVVFTVPALQLAGVRHGLGYWEVSLMAALGGLLGVLLVIPLRRPVTVDAPELTYPESVTSATITRTGAGGRRALLPAGLALLAGAAFKSLSGVVQVISGTVEGAFRVGGVLFYGGADISLALAGVGLVLRLRVAALLLLGGVISWGVAIPLLAGPAGPAGLVALAWDTWRGQARYLGIGAMVVSGCWSVVRARASIGGGVRHALDGLRRAGRGVAGADADLPLRWVPAGGVVIWAGIAGLTLAMTGSAVLAVVTATLAVVLVFFLAAVAATVVGVVGNSNSPVSGLAICALLAAAPVLTLVRAGTGTPVVAAALLVAVLVCTATATAGDTAQHFKTTQLLGGTPRRVQLVQLLGVGVFAFVVAPVVVLLLSGYGLGPGSQIKAPQAVVFANLAGALFDGGDLPVGMLAAGAGLGVVLILAGRMFPRLPVMAVAIGMYLPLSLSVPMFAGGLTGELLERAARRHSPAAGRASYDRAVLVCSGLITGEALAGLAAAVPRSMGVDLPVRVLDSAPLSLAALAAVLAGVYRHARGSRATAVPAGRAAAGD